MQDYRNEIKDFFAVDKQLAAELEYDMKKYEEQLAKEKESDQEQVLAAQAEQPPSLERAVLSGGWRNNAQSPLSRRQSLPPGSSPSSVPSECTTSITDVLKEPLLRHRPASLSTLAILNSARKAREAKSKQRSRSVGGSLSAVSLPSSTAGSKQVFFQSLNQQSTRENVSVVGRAISTPEQPINNLTFGAEVSYISLTQTPSSAPGKVKGEDKPRDIICLTSLEKLPSLPQEWKVESPAREKSSQRVPLRRSQRRTPLKPDN